MEQRSQNPSDVPALEAASFRRLFERAAVALLAVDAEFRIVFHNPAAADVLAAQGDSWQGRPIEELVPPERRDLLNKALKRTVRDLRVQQFEVSLPDAAGTRRDLLVVLSPIPDATGGCEGVACWLVDQTRHKGLAEQLAEAEKYAALGTLSAGVAHHFNNILGGVATFVDFALTSGEPVAMRRALQMTAEAATRVSRLTDSLLSYARQDGASTDLADLTEVVLTFGSLAEKPLEQLHIDLRMNLQPVPVVEVNKARMHRVLANLLANAEEAMPSGGRLDIAVDRDADNVTVTFADTGCGIDPKHLSQVFEPFFTTKGALAGGEKSNPGLGLAVVRGLVTEMGGRIDVESPSAQGTRLTLRFPLPAAG